VRRAAWYGLIAAMAVLVGTLAACAGPTADNSGSGLTVNDYVGLPAAISCSSANSCLAVGTVGTEGGVLTGSPTADAWNGKIWRAIPVRLPQGTGGGLTGVSCKAGTCLAIGDVSPNAGGYSSGVAFRWNGEKLTPIPAPPPAGGEEETLDNVSCVTATDCITMVDSMTSGGAVIDTWNGVRWTSQAAADPDGVAEYLVTISCVSAAYCVLGGDDPDSPGSIKPALASWNGATITPMRTPAPAATDVSTDNDPPVIYGVSCVSRISCVAVGTYNTDSQSTTGFGFTEVLSGTTWREATISAPPGTSRSMLYGVSCLTADSCLAVGSAVWSIGGSLASAAVVSYNGSQWTWQTDVPASGAKQADYFGGVACATTRDCVAAGQAGPAPWFFARPYDRVLK
jgi:hypothetical protein